MHSHESHGRTFITTPGLLTATGGVTTHDTTATINYYLNGVMRQKTAITTGATPTTDILTGLPITLTANKACVVVWLLDSAGTVRVAAGPVVDWNGTSFNVPPPFPDIDHTVYCPFATQMLKASSAAGTITFGSSNWNATGFTNSILNGGLPARPRTV